MKEKLNENDLREFSGTENYYLHFTKRFQYTDGVKYLADKAGAYWLLDAIASHQPRKEEFQIWIFRKEGAHWVLEMFEDYSSDEVLKTGKNPYPCLVRQEIPMSDFPLNHIKLYVQNDVLFLPSEY